MSPNPATGPRFLYREGCDRDIIPMSRVFAHEWESGDTRSLRISGYLRGDLHPQQALLPRVNYVATEGDALVGFVAGHLTRRFGCEGELEWINVVSAFRGTEVASGLLRLLAAWFSGRQALRVCVDVTPDNARARRFYSRHGARDLKPSWMVWDDIRTAF